MAMVSSPMEAPDAPSAGERGAVIDLGSSFVSQASRPDYLSSLRSGRIPSLRLEGSSADFSSFHRVGDVDASPTSAPRDAAAASAAATATTATAAAAIPDTAGVDVTEFRRRLSCIRDAKSRRGSLISGGGIGDTRNNINESTISKGDGGGQRQQQRAPVLQKVEVRIKDYSYHVPVRVDAPSIKTVFNTSPCYAATNIMKNVVELATGKRQVCVLVFDLHWESNCCRATEIKDMRTQ